MLFRFQIMSKHNLSCLYGAQWLNRRFASSRVIDVRVTMFYPRARHRNWYKTEGYEIVPIRLGWKILKQTDLLPAANYWIHPGRPIPRRPKDCWLGRKESSHASQNKQTNKPNAPTLPCQAQLSLINVKSLQICWATPTPSIHRKLLLGVSKKTYWCPGYNDTVLDADSRVWIFMMHGRIQKILSGGLGVLKTLF